VWELVLPAWRAASPRLADGRALGAAQGRSGLPGRRPQRRGAVRPAAGVALTRARRCAARQAFLSLCQGNHYQFDSMRRAKHSSMMVLYHLHNPDAPAFVCTCNQCGVEIEPGQGFRCTVCQDFDMCANCRMTAGHQHPLTVRARPVPHPAPSRPRPVLVGGKRVCAGTMQSRRPAAEGASHRGSARARCPQRCALR